MPTVIRPSGADHQAACASSSKRLGGIAQARSLPGRDGPVRDTRTQPPQPLGSGVVGPPRTDNGKRVTDRQCVTGLVDSTTMMGGYGVRPKGHVTPSRRNE